MAKRKIPDHMLSPEQLKKRIYNENYRKKKKSKVVTLFPNGDKMSSAEKKEVDKEISLLNEKISQISFEKNSLEEIKKDFSSISQSIEKLKENIVFKDEIKVIARKEFEAISQTLIESINEKFSHTVQLQNEKISELSRVIEKSLEKTNEKSPTELAGTSSEEGVKSKPGYLYLFYALIALFYYFVFKETYNFNMTWAGDKIQAFLATLMWDGSIALLGICGFLRVLSKNVRASCLGAATLLVAANIAAVTIQKNKSIANMSSNSEVAVEAKKAVKKAEDEVKDAEQVLAGWQEKFNYRYYNSNTKEAWLKLPKDQQKTNPTSAERLYGKYINDSTAALDAARKVLNDEKEKQAGVKSSYQSSSQANAVKLEFWSHAAFYAVFWVMIFFLKFIMTQLRQAASYRLAAQVLR